MLHVEIYIMLVNNVGFLSAILCCFFKQLFVKISSVSYTVTNQKALFSYHIYCKEWSALLPSLFFLMTIVATWKLYSPSFEKAHKNTKSLKNEEVLVSETDQDGVYLSTITILLNRNLDYISFCLYLERHWPNHNLCFSFLKDRFSLSSFQWLHQLPSLACNKGRSSFVLVLWKWIWKKWPYNYYELSSINLRLSSQISIWDFLRKK